MIEVASFSYLFGQNANFDGYAIFDCRQLPDPEGLGIGSNGTDNKVQAYVFGKSGSLASQMIQSAVNAAHESDNLAFGCHAGKNRSVAMAQLTSTMLYLLGIEHRVTHWNLGYWL